MRRGFWILTSMITAMCVIASAACSGGGDESSGTATPVDPTAEAIAAITQSAISTEEAPAPVLNTRAPGPSEQPTPASGELALAVSAAIGTGLIDVLVPQFETETGYAVTISSLGSVAAVDQASRGEADVVLVDAPLAELALLADADGIDRVLVMSSDYLLVGPETDPAAVLDQERADDAFAAIAAASSPFVGNSADLDVGALEASIWAKRSIVPTSEAWYELAPNALERATSMGAYTLATRNAFLGLPRSSPSLQILIEGDPALVAAYHVIVVNPETHPGVNVDAARAFAAFITRPDIQQIIGEYGIAEFGAASYTPQAGNADPRG